MEITLKPAIQADYEYARRIHHSAYREMVEKQFGRWDESVQDGFFLRTWERQAFSIVWANGTPSGFCSIGESEKAIELLEFAIDPEVQGNGIGKTVLGELIERGRKERKSVYLNVMKTNTRAKLLYESLGFLVYGENDFQFLLRQEFSNRRRQRRKAPASERDVLRKK